MSFQGAYEINPGRGYIGALARDAEPWAIDQVPAQVPTSGRNVRPGDQVYWDTTNNGAAAVTDAAQQELAFGIATYFPGRVAEILSSIPSGANSPNYVQYKDGELMPVLVMGTVWLLAGAALEYGTQIVQHATDRDWVVGTNAQPSNLNTLLKAPVHCVDTAVTDASVFMARIGFGRVY